MNCVDSLAGLKSGVILVLSEIATEQYRKKNKEKQKAMDYYDEFNWQPIDPVSRQRHQDLLFARFLFENGFAPDRNEFELDGVAPPASKQIVASLERKLVKIDRINVDKNTEKCVICLKLDPADTDADADTNNTDGTNNKSDEKTFIVLPCRHSFHSECIIPWLNRTNTCPLCRFELKTDDPNYETYKAQRARIAQRDQELETLHSSMFG